MCDYAGSRDCIRTVPLVEEQSLSEKPLGHHLSIKKEWFKLENKYKIQRWITEKVFQIIAMEKL